MSFSTSAHCASRMHCVICRHRGERGRAWREAMEGIGLSVPAECPHGVPMGYVDLSDPEVMEQRRTLVAGGCCGSPSNG